MPEDPRLTLTGVVKSYGAVRAIRHADFELQPGRCTPWSGRTARESPR